MADEELRIIATAETADAEAKMKSLAGAKAEVATEADSVTESVEGAGAATDSTASSMSDLVTIIAGVNPAFGNLANIALKVTQVLGNLGSANIDLRKLSAASTGAVKELSGALKLVGAGGGVVAGIMAIVAAYKELAEEAERVEAAIRGITAAQNEQKAAQLDVTQQAITTSQARGQIGAASLEDIETAVRQAGQVGRKFPGLAATAEAQAGEFAGLGLSVEQLTQAAQLGAAGRLTTTADLSAQGRVNELESQIRINAASLAAGQQTRLGLGGRIAAEAERELGAAPGFGATGSIEEFARRQPGLAAGGLDLGRVAQLAQLLEGGATAGDVKFRDLFPGAGNIAGKAIAGAVAGEGQEFLRLQKLVEVAEGEGIAGATPAEVQAAMILRQDISRAGGGSVVIQNTNNRHFNNGAAARGQVTKTGERRRQAITNRGRR